MDEKFKIFIDVLHPKFLALINSTPMKIKDIVKGTSPEGGIYLFSRGKKYLYVGRTKRNILVRLKNHINISSKDAPFAFKLARMKTGFIKASYKGSETRKNLMKNKKFVKAYQEAKNKIKKMDVRFVEEKDSIKQTLLEVYVSVVLNAKFNDFDTH